MTNTDDDSVYLRVGAQDVWDFLRYICKEGGGERPSQTDFPEDGVLDDESSGLLSGGNGRSSGPIVPVRCPGVMTLGDGGVEAESAIAPCP